MSFQGAIFCYGSQCLPSAVNRQQSSFDRDISVFAGFGKKDAGALVSSFLSTHFYFSKCPELEIMLSQTVEEWDSKRFGYKSVIGALMEILLTKITRLYVPEFTDIPESDDTLNDRRFLIIEHAFITNPHITLAELSEHIGLCARTNAEVDLEWTAENVTITITSDKAQTIKVSVYGEKEQNITFNAGQTKEIVLNR